MSAFVPAVSLFPAALSPAKRDISPLKVAGQPEKRRYRLCFWDGEPSRVWSPAIEVVFGG